MTATSVKQVALTEEKAIELIDNTRVAHEIGFEAGGVKLKQDVTAFIDTLYDLTTTKKLDIRDLYPIIYRIFFASALPWTENISRIKIDGKETGQYALTFGKTKTVGKNNVALIDTVPRNEVVTNALQTIQVGTALKAKRYGIVVDGSEASLETLAEIATHIVISVGAINKLVYFDGSMITPHFAFTVDWWLQKSSGNTKLGQIVIEENAGRTLHSVLEDKQTNISLDFIKSIFFQVLFSLLAAQKKFEFVHGDLHTENIMIRDPPDSMKDKPWKYVINNQEIVIPVAAHKNNMVEIIDFGCSSANVTGSGKNKVRFGNIFARRTNNDTDTKDFSFDARYCSMRVFETIRGKVKENRLEDVAALLDAIGKITASVQKGLAIINSSQQNNQTLEECIEMKTPSYDKFFAWCSVAYNVDKTKTNEYIQNVLLAPNAANKLFEINDRSTNTDADGPIVGILTFK